MSRKEIGMRKLKELLRYKALGISQNQTERALRVSGKTIRKYWLRADGVGLIYSDGLAEEDIEKRLIVDFGEEPAPHRLDHCDWKRIADEVTKSKVGLNIIWEEEIAAGRFHLSYSQFCRRFTRHHRKSALSFHKEYEPGKIAEVDFCDGIDVVDLRTGEIIKTDLFLMTLGASRYTYGEFCLRQDLPTWLDLHTHAFEYFGGVPEAVVPDNLKSGVAHACRYEPDINPAYAEFTCHYGFVVLPARVGKPKDKPLVERSVMAFQRWFYQRHRERRFTSLAELNEQLWEDLPLYNQKIHRRFGESRKTRFDRLEREKLKPLPERRFEMATWKKAKLHPDCHAVFDYSFYSAPYQLRGDYLDIRATSAVVEIYRKGNRVAVHRRSFQRGCYVTRKEHLPPQHQAILEITPQNILKQAREIGESTEQMVRELMAKYGHPTLGLRACQGVVRLKNRYSAQRLEAACRRALEYKSITFRAVNKILARGLDRQVHQAPDWDVTLRRMNPNLRGREYFH